jgi:hypothetical protein
VPSELLPSSHCLSSSEQRAESTRMAYGLCRVLRNYLHYALSNQIFARSATGHRLRVCRPNLRFNNTTDL